MGAAALTRVVTQGLTAKAMFEQSIKRGSGGRPLAIWGKVFQAERKEYTNLCAEIRLGLLTRNSPGTEHESGRVTVGGEIRKVGQVGQGYRLVSHREGRASASLMRWEASRGS